MLIASAVAVWAFAFLDGAVSAQQGDNIKTKIEFKPAYGIEPPWGGVIVPKGTYKFTPPKGWNVTVLKIDTYRIDPESYSMIEGTVEGAKFASGQFHGKAYKDLAPGTYMLVVGIRTQITNPSGGTEKGRFSKFSDPISIGN
jgi:hypothetical protein